MAVFVGEQATTRPSVIGARSDSVTRVETGPMMASTLSAVDELLEGDGGLRRVARLVGRRSARPACR